ncbi:ankyrin repeat, SAM and basic leucine zipper domain-containing protein 1 [Gastrophryne carolinensis]
MAAALFHAVPGGGESSDSGEEWDLADNLELKEPHILNTLDESPESPEDVKFPRLGEEVTGMVGGRGQILSTVCFGEIPWTKRLQQSHPREFGEPIMQPAVETSEGLLKNALTMGDVKLVQNLLDSGLSIECWFQYGWTPLMYAASVANMEIMRLLLNRGANANFERDSFTVLMAACTAHGSEENIVKCVELLLSRNVDANVCCRKSMTSLMLAAREGYTRVVTLLVAHGAEINAQDGNGFTALTWAAHNGHKNTVLKLIELGADKKLSTKNGNTAADLAKRNNHLEILSILSFSGQPYQESGFTKGEAMYRYLKAQPESTTVSNFGCLASSDLEVFLHGLGLGHLSEVLMENNITLRQLLSLEEGDLRKAGVTDEEDCKKMVSAVGEIQVEETKLGTLPVLSNAESSGDELFAFLLKLNRQCSSLTLALEAVSNQIPANPQKVVLEWDSSQNILPVCEDLVTSVLNLGKEVGRLQELLQKFQVGQKSNPCRMPPLEEQNSWRCRRLVRRTSLTVLGLGIIISVVLFSVKRKAI